MRKYGIAFLFMVGALFGSAQTPAAPPPVNIVIIFTDDQGYSDVGCYGARGFETPNLDRLAAEGLRFTDFYVAQAVCSPSRAGLLTGCYPNRIGIPGVLFPDSKYGLNADEMTMAELLKQKGYATGIFGKWHLGHLRPFLPLQHGFDEYLGLPYSNNMWLCGFGGKRNRRKIQSGYPELPLIEGNEKVGEIRNLADQDMLTTRYTERAVDFIARHKDEPFFLYVPHSMVHVPLGVSDRYRGKSEQGLYGDVMMEVDWSVGQIMKALEENGVAENTLLIFTSDNGPWLSYGKHGGTCRPLREGKGTTWEGGFRVPCIMRWPGHIAPGRTTDRIAATIDLLPTVAEIAGTKLPEHEIDGVSILPLLNGDEGANPRRTFVYYQRNELQAVREDNWKLHFPHEYRSYEGRVPGRNGFPGKGVTGRTDWALYDLATDAGERKNVAAEHPDIVERLKVLGTRHRDELNAHQRPAGTTSS